MNISVNDLRNGTTIIIDGELFTVVDFQHAKQARGGAHVWTKVKSLKTGQVLEKTYRGGEKVDRAFIETKKMQFLYNAGDELVLMDNETYDQMHIPVSQVGDGVKWLKEGMELSLLMYDGQAIGVDLPLFVDLLVTQTDPGFKGDTATGGNKPATLETGAVINVPLFVKIDDIVQIDTRTGSYLKRV